MRNTGLPPFSLQSAPQILYTVWRTREKPSMVQSIHTLSIALRSATFLQWLEEGCRKPELGAWVQSHEQVALALEVAALFTNVEN